MIGEDARKRRLRVRANRLVVVNANDRHVFGDFQSHRLRTVQNGRPHQVVRREDAERTRCGRQPTAQRLARPFQVASRDIRVKDPAVAAGASYQLGKAKPPVTTPIGGRRKGT